MAEMRNAEQFVAWVNRLADRTDLINPDATGDELYVQAVEAAKQLTPDERRIAAAIYLIQQFKETHRSRVAAIERRAMKPADPPPAAQTPEQKAREEEVNRKYRERMEEIDRRHNARIAGIIADFADQVRMQWTAELLGATFTLNSGRCVTWGEATVVDHEQRCKELTAMARGTMETASRHAAALETLETAGVSCLNEAVAAQRR